MNRFIFLFFVFVLSPVVVADGDVVFRPHETEISAAWCEAQGGIAEFRLADGARVDCLTDEYAIEHDFGKGGKPYECLGQAQYYARETGRIGVCVLIRRRGQDLGEFVKYARRAIVAGVVEVWCIFDDGVAMDCLTGRVEE